LVDLAADLSELGLDVRTSDLAIALDHRCHEPSSSLPLGRLLFHPAMDAPASTTATTSTMTQGSHDQWRCRWLPVSVCMTRRAASNSSTRPRPNTSEPATPKSTKRPRLRTGSTVSCLK